MFYLVSFLLLLSVQFSYADTAPSFHEQMSGNIFYSKKRAKKLEEWKLLQKMYNRSQKKKKLSNRYLIPKKIHIVWLHDYEMDQDLYLTIESWKRFHPEWSIKIWRREEVELFDMKRRDAYIRAVDIHEKTYIAQYEILYQIGGLMIDPQFEALSSFDQYHRSCSFYSSVWDLKKPGITGSFYAAEKRHPILFTCLQSLPKVNCGFDYGAIYTRFGPKHLTQSFFQAIKKRPQIAETCLIFPVDALFPWPRYRRWEEGDRAKWITKKSLALYHWDKTE